MLLQNLKISQIGFLAGWSGEVRGACCCWLLAADRASRCCAHHS